MRRSLLLTAGLIVLAVAAAACGDDDAADVSQGETTTTASTPPAEAGDDNAPPTVAVADNDLGSILVDGEGRTLYLFTRDSADASMCTDTCLTNWPALEAPEELVAGDGVDESKLGRFTRSDGTEQVTYASMPLYYFVADRGPGDTNGQGVNDVWWVVAPDGEPVTGAPSPAGDGY